jgi:hypothetical protein
MAKIKRNIFLFLLLSFVLIENSFAKEIFSEKEISFFFKARNLSREQSDFQEKISAFFNEEVEFYFLIEAQNRDFKNLILFFEIPKEIELVQNKDIQKGIFLGPILKNEKKEIFFRGKIKEGSLKNPYLFLTVKILGDGMEAKRKTLIIELKEKEVPKSILKPAGFFEQLTLTFNDPFSFCFVISFFLSLIREFYLDLKEKIKTLFFSNKILRLPRNFFLNFQISIFRFLKRVKVRKT